ncbi:hypothetical protein [Leeuwenhoekiella palythoae]|uniref:Uncharacterized protein n=1 Tax=Leeuwenhoekiella palythoae TaxID=573501 RepID=A0A1M5U1G8_9FLAO|nr:hypothetical protein [Leeuwenhoekiella palythoae]RXG27533.1 hypothetical protein DSM01_3052 [Leeuwenhoekiella palythoae]SHH56710.1 hypothetical protein SAMN04487999_0522 [Leeuwenhoekiella palythoae]
MRTFRILLLIPLLSYAQNQAPRALIDKALLDYESEITGSQFVNDKTLNILIGDVLNQYLPNTKISTQRLSFLLDDDDNSFSLTGNFDPRLTKTSYQSFLASGGLKLKGEPTGSFYNFKDSNWAENIGAQFKLTWFIPGTLTKNADHQISRLLKTYREKTIKNLALETLETKPLDSQELEELIATKEAEYILKNDLYVSMYKFWVTLQGYIPLTKSSNTFTNTTDASIKSEHQFEAWEASLSINGFYKGKIFSFSFSAIPRVYQNNNILTETVKKRTFTSFEGSPEGQPALTTTDSYYYGAYEEFTSGQVKAEVASLYKDCIGLSAAVEQNFWYGYDALNWKLGIPLNLKNKDGASSIAFEIQWREFNKQHYLGISLGKAFGKFLD